MNCAHFRSEFRIAYRSWPEWAQQIYGELVAEQLDELEGLEAFGGDTRDSVAWLSSRLAAWRDGSLSRVPPPRLRLPSEPVAAWLERMLSCWDEPATILQVWPPATS